MKLNFEAAVGLILVVIVVMFLLMFALNVTRLAAERAPEVYECIERCAWECRP